MNADSALVLVTTSFPIGGDGSEAAGSFVSDLAEEISRHMPVRVVAPGSAAGIERWSDNVEVFRFAAPSQPLSTLRVWHPTDWRTIAAVMRSGRTTTCAAVAAGPCTHVLALWALPSGYWARQAALEAGLSYSVWTLGSDIWTLGRIPLVRLLLRRVLRDAKYCFSDGLRLGEDTRAISGRCVEFLPSTRRISCIRAIPPRTTPPYRLLFLGRWHPNKGVDLLLEALRLLDENTWARIESVAICGGGPLESRVRSEVDALQAAKRPLVLRGYLDKCAAEMAIRETDWLLIPSRIESIPVVFSDAMKLSCPVISTPVGDLAELTGTPSPCGVLAQAATAKAFAHAIESATSLSPKSFAAGVDEMAKRFDLAAISRRIETMVSYSNTDE